jgi:hypothetical protein
MKYASSRALGDWWWIPYGDHPLDDAVYGIELEVPLEEGARPLHHPVEEVEVSLLHGKEGRLVDDVPEGLGPGPLLLDLAGEADSPLEEVPVLWATPTFAIPMTMAETICSFSARFGIWFARERRAEGSWNSMKSMSTPLLWIGLPLPCGFKETW